MKESYSTREVSQMTGLTVGNIQQRHHRIKKLTGIDLGKHRETSRPNIQERIYSYYEVCALNLTPQGFQTFLLAFRGFSALRGDDTVKSIFMPHVVAGLLIFKDDYFHLTNIGHYFIGLMPK